MESSTRNLPLRLQNFATLSTLSTPKLVRKGRVDVWKVSSYWLNSRENWMLRRLLSFNRSLFSDNRSLQISKRRLLFSKWSLLLIVRSLVFRCRKCSMFFKALWMFKNACRALSNSCHNSRKLKKVFLVCCFVENLYLCKR